MREEKKSNLHWHPAFVEAIKMELKPYLDKIEILPEVPLTTEPLRIDCIIIKKQKIWLLKKHSRYLQGLEHNGIQKPAGSCFN